MYLQDFRCDVVTSTDDDGAVFSGNDEPAWREVGGSGEEGRGGSEVGEKEMGMDVVDDEVTRLDVSMAEEVVLVEPVERGEGVDSPDA